MAMAAERLWTGRTEGNLGNSCSGSISRLALRHRRCCSVKGFGSAVLPIVDLRLQQQRTRVVRRSGGERAVRCIAQLVREESVPVPSQRIKYDDSWIEVRAVEFLSDRVAHVCGKTTDLKGYDGLVDITRKFVNGLPSKQQQDRVIELLHVVLPQWFVYFIRIVPKTTGVKELYANFTLVFFKWLVGECEVREGEINGIMMKSTVYIKKCRYLEQSQCVGLCVNLCKNPTQLFIREQLGMPLTMNPNFEDMSCEMIFGLHPPPLDEDPAHQQPCYALCKTAKTKSSCA